MQVVLNPSALRLVLDPNAVAALKQSSPLWFELFKAALPGMFVFLAAFLAYWFAMRRYFAQQRDERLRVRYMDRGLEVVATQLARARQAMKEQAYILRGGRVDPHKWTPVAREVKECNRDIRRALGSGTALARVARLTGSTIFTDALFQAAWVMGMLIDFMMAESEPNSARMKDLQGAHGRMEAVADAAAVSIGLHVQLEHVLDSIIELAETYGPLTPRKVRSLRARSNAKGLIRAATATMERTRHAQQKLIDAVIGPDEETSASRLSSNNPDQPKQNS